MKISINMFTNKYHADFDTALGLVESAVKKQKSHDAKKIKLLHFTEDEESSRVINGLANKLHIPIFSLTPETYYLGWTKVLESMSLCLTTLLSKKISIIEFNSVIDEYLLLILDKPRINFSLYQSNEILIDDKILFYSYNQNRKNPKFRYYKQFYESLEELCLFQNSVVELFTSENVHINLDKVNLSQESNESRLFITIVNMLVLQYVLMGVNLFGNLDCYFNSSNNSFKEINFNQILINFTNEKRCSNRYKYINYEKILKHCKNKNNKNKLAILHKTDNENDWKFNILSFLNFIIQ